MRTYAYNLTVSQESELDKSLVRIGSLLVFKISVSQILSIETKIKSCLQIVVITD